MKIAIKKKSIEQIIKEEIDNVIREQEGLSIGTQSQKDKEDQKKLDAKKPNSQESLPKIENPDYDSGLASLLQTKRGSISIAEMLFNLGRGLLPRGQLGDVFELKSILKNNKSARNRKGRNLVFAMDTLLNDMIAVAKTKKDPEATYTVTTSSSGSEKIRYDSKILKDEARNKMGQALIAMVASYSINTEDPKFKEIYAKKAGKATVNEGGLFDRFWLWVEKFINDIWEFVHTPVASSLAFVESAIRAPETILRQAASVMGIGEQRKQMAAAVVYPDWKITIAGSKVPLGHAAMLLIHPIGEAEEGKEQEYQLKAYEFGRYVSGKKVKDPNTGKMVYPTTSRSRYGVNSSDIARTRKKLGYTGGEASNESLGTKRSTKIPTSFKFEWNSIGQLTNETQINIIDALRSTSRYGSYAKGSYTRVAWLMDIDVKKAEAEALKFEVRPYGALWLGAGSEKGEFGYFKGNKWVEAGETAVENCATFVATCLQSANKNYGGTAVSAVIRRQALAHPNAMISALANELDEEVTSYGTGNKTSTNTNIAWKILGTASGGKGWADDGKARFLHDSASASADDYIKIMAAAKRKVKNGSAIAASARRLGATNSSVYKQLAKVIPSEILDRKEFRRWNKGNPGGRTKWLVAMYQTIRKLDVDGRIGGKTWGRLKRE